MKKKKKNGTKKEMAQWSSIMIVKDLMEIIQFPNEDEEQYKSF